MKAYQLQDLLLDTLVRQHGGERRRWRSALGTLRIHNVETYPHCNWSVAPSGSAGQNAKIERLLDEIRNRYPIVIAD